MLRGQDFFSLCPVISSQSTWVLYELMCWLSLVVRSPPARRSLSWIQSTVDWCMAPRKWGFDLKSNSTNYPDHGHHGDPPPHKENPHGRAENRIRDLVISSQKLWPLDHEAVQGQEITKKMAETLIQQIMKLWMMLHKSTATCLAVQTFKNKGDNIRKYKGKAFQSKWKWNRKLSRNNQKQ